jgi:hypothetical protein
VIFLFSYKSFATIDAIGYPHKSPMKKIGIVSIENPVIAAILSLVLLFFIRMYGQICFDKTDIGKRDGKRLVIHFSSDPETLSKTTFGNKNNRDAINTAPPPAAHFIFSDIKNTALQ